ncbi:DDE-type integrase/transposase/recombinase [Donghicola tyrosinivorans]|uniref:Integrase-like protein n=1 Tax=Donghicola tyrosinivorans TaxID=1652492 RepID=A0A2T0WS19_9RHOB|nr:DDE-type integrase/transposase/recombinase [Donghicola tyrosinivorans]PRY89503.1 integrase-like protein [Donghicola tyrosinivorans]
MTTDPRYNYNIGTEITLLDRTMSVANVTENGYSMVSVEDGTTMVVTFSRLIECLKLPGAKINSALATTGDRLRYRLRGYASVKALKNPEQRALARYHLAMCKAVDIYVAMRREDDPKFKPSGRSLNPEKAREFIAKQTSLLLGERVRVKPQRGGEKSKDRILYRGRTINEYYQRYKALDHSEGAEEALVPLIHMRGNRKPRLCPRIRELMTEAWEKIGLDKKKTSVANVHAYLKTLIHKENLFRRLNDLPDFVTPAEKTLQQHRDTLVTETEFLIATNGQRETRRNRGRGSKDVRALAIGEWCGMDENKFSMVVSMKKAGLWSKLSEDEKAIVQKVDEYIRKRLHILILYDVASRMPLAWIITENPNSDATLALLRMATRDKTREQRRYGCQKEPARGCGILYLRNDNGTGLRNAKVIEALTGMGTINGITRTFHPEDRASDERIFGTLESRFFKLMPGYTGRRPGELPGYDAILNGVVDVETLYAMLTRYLVDEYPFERHYGVGMGGRRPWDVYQEINKSRGQVGLQDPNVRRIQLGWEVSATPSDEGVRVFGGIWFNSDALQETRDQQFFKGKVQVFVDPDNLNIATVLMPGYHDPIEVHLQMTVFADMTIGEVLQLMAEYRREDPETTEIYQDHLMQVKSRRFAEISSIGVEHDLPRSYTTIEECQALAKTIFAGARVIRTETLSGTTAPNDITNLTSGTGVFQIGGGSSVIDGVVADGPEETAGDMTNPAENPAVSGAQLPSITQVEAERPELRKGKASSQSEKLARPKNLKELK